MAKKKRNEKIRLVIVDMAGTIVDYGSQAPTEAFIALFKEYGIDVCRAEVNAFMGTEKRTHLEAILMLPRVISEWQKLYNSDWTPQDVEKLYQRLLPILAGCVKERSVLIPGAGPVIRGWRSEGIKIATTTGYNRQLANIILHRMNWDDCAPDASVCADDVPAGRPAPWMIFRAMELCGVYPASAVVNIGDTIPDIESGKNAGVWSVGVAATGAMMPKINKRTGFSTEYMLQMISETTKKMRSAGADFVAEDIKGCNKLVNLINSGKK